MLINQYVLNLVTYQEYQGLSDTEAAALANTKSIQKSDNTPKKPLAISRIVGIEKGQQLYTAIQAAGYDMIKDILNTDGLDFSSSRVREMIDAFVHRNAFSQADGDELKAIGIWYVSPYENQGGQGQCTAQDWAQARLYGQLRGHASSRYNEAVQQIEAGNVQDLAALKSILGA